MTYPRGLRMGFADAREVVWGPFLSCTMGYISRGKEVQENGHIYVVFFMVSGFWWGHVGSPVFASPPGVKDGVGWCKKVVWVPILGWYTEIIITWQRGSGK